MLNSRKQDAELSTLLFANIAGMVVRSCRGAAQALADWPPHTEGEKAVAAKWFAVAKGGALFLAQKPPTSNNKFVPMVTVQLADCKIEIPKEGLRNKSQYGCLCILLFHR